VAMELADTHAEKAPSELDNRKDVQFSFSLQ
jgi:hypothetical protein